MNFEQNLLEGLIILKTPVSDVILFCKRIENYMFWALVRLKASDFIQRFDVVLIEKYS